MRSIYWQNLVILMIGVWLCFSPWIFGYFAKGSTQADVENWNLLLSGTVVIILSVIAIMTSQRWEVWFEMLVAGWLVVSPWLLGFQAQPFGVVNLILAGGILFLMTIWILSKTGRAREW